MSDNQNPNAEFIWSVADLLRGDFKRSQYGRIILPFTLLRRMECVLASTKQAVLDLHQAMGENALEILLLTAAKQAFYNTSSMTLGKLGERGTLDNLNHYLKSFSANAYQIFDYFNFAEFAAQLNDADLLYQVVNKFREMDLSPQTLSNHDMGLMFEELIRRFAESSNETAGEHFTPRDIVRLTTALVIMEDDKVNGQSKGIIRTIYDPTAGTGGFLSSSSEYIHSIHPTASIKVYGQELNPESYAICKGDMLIKGQEIENLKLGNTLSNDQLPNQKFDYMLSNPPFGVDWKKVEKVIKDEHELKGMMGRFGAGLPRVSDGSLLFLMHLLSKMHSAEDNPSRIGIILNGSPLFTGGAGSGESEIRRYVLENDLLEGIIALPNDMFYNTGIATYIWILSNHKIAERKDKVLLVDATNDYNKMRKSLGNKRNVLSEEQINTLVRLYDAFTPSAKAKIFATTAFGYRRITVERPLRLSAQFTAEKITSLRYLPSIREHMEALYAKLGENLYEAFDECEETIQHYIDKHRNDLKGGQVRDLQAADTWSKQLALLGKAQQLQQTLGETQYDDFNAFDALLKKTCKKSDIKLDAWERKQLLDAITWKNPAAEKVIKKLYEEMETSELYGFYDYIGKSGYNFVEYEADSDLRDYENVPLCEDIETYFQREVLPHVPEAWIDSTKRDTKDKQIGIIGYEIPFNRHFYQYSPPRALEAIDADLATVSDEIMAMLKEIGAK
ncbi:SAM-dependent DNA methyltransferase [Thiothrix litoralis]|uniref:site-specific DNA-methyltransferase (adenine-specific) n=1 Tax=Thiothrix litoralis TaxID=2891210 RepID=A0ABX7WX63_9GAMM|nr:class I SAM-dependent DNA methyltransferase [Thiothrix litoralis]QTR45525.1 SAM-dependent DNA methyltransferase [Thiothrix litoralis]